MAAKSAKRPSAETAQEGSGKMPLIGPAICDDLLLTSISEALTLIDARLAKRPDGLVESAAIESKATVGSEETEEAQ